MAGKRHHIIPRSLQKGFASRVERKKNKNAKVFVVQYLKGKNAGREESTRNTMASENYYGKGEASADLGMTDFENEFLAPCVQSLRDGAEISGREIAELLAHFSIRPKLIREAFTSMSKQFMEELSGMIGDKSIWSQAFESMPSEFLGELFDDLPSNVDPESEDGKKLILLEEAGFDLGQLGQFAAAFMEASMDDPESREALTSIASSTLSKAMTVEDGVIETSIKKGHVQSIKNQVVPEKRVEFFEQFTWEIQECDFDLILGDCGLFYISRKQAGIVPFCDLDDVLAVFLPISSRLLIRGFRSADEQIERFNAAVNAEIAKCSHDEFIASCEKEEFNHLIPLIRGYDPSFSGMEELNEAIEGMRRDIMIGKIFSKDC
jgi:hypothetical protein